MRGPQALRVAVLGLAAGSVGCAPPRPEPLFTDRLVSQIVVVSEWHHREPTGDVAPGVDLDDQRSDGRGSGLCAEQRDYEPYFPSEGLDSCAYGVDNQYGANILPLVINPDGSGAPCRPCRDAFDQELRDQLAAGLLWWGFEVEPLGSATVAVRLLRLEPVGTPTTDAEGRLVGPQSVRVLAREAVPADCLGWSVRATFVGPLELPLGARLVSRPVEEPRVRLDIDDGGRVVRGELGAAISMDVAISAFAVFVPGVDESFVRAIAQPDLDPRPGGVTCERISLGVHFEVVPAVVVE